MLAITTKAKHTVELQDIISYENIRFPPNNGAIHNVAEIFKVVMSSATEAEMGALYIHGRKAVEERNILEELGHPQFPTPIQTDNSTAEGMINKKGATQTHKGDGHAIPLAPRRRCQSAAIPILLAARTPKLRRLLD